MKFPPANHPPAWLLPAIALIFSGCAAPPAPDDASPPAERPADAGNFHTAANRIPTQPWENGYRTAEEREIMLSRERRDPAIDHDFRARLAADDCVRLRRTPAAPPDSSFAAEAAWIGVKQTADLGYRAAKKEIRDALK